MANPEEIGLFAYLNTRYGKQLGGRVFTRLFKKGTRIYAPPEKLNYMFELVKGGVKLGTITEQGTELVYELIEAGEFFGNLQLLNGQFSEFGKSVVDSEIRLYEIGFFKSVVVQDPLLAEWFLRKMTKRWCKAENRLIQIGAYDPRERIRHCLDRLQKPLYDAQGKPYFWNDVITMKEVADLTATTRQLVAQTSKSVSTAESRHQPNH
jgi:CRP-like cAMP-binding protein